MLDTFLERLDMPEHHGRGRPAPQLVPDSMHVEPVVSHHLAASDCRANPISQNLPAAPWQTAQTGALEPLEHSSQWKLGTLVK